VKQEIEEQQVAQVLKDLRVQPARKEQQEQQDLKVHRVLKVRQEQMVAVRFTLTVKQRILKDKSLLPIPKVLI
jgi:hypothetical protein